MPALNKTLKNLKNESIDGSLPNRPANRFGPAFQAGGAAGLSRPGAQGLPDSPRVNGVPR